MWKETKPVKGKEARREYKSRLESVVFVCQTRGGKTGKKTIQQTYIRINYGFPLGESSTSCLQARTTWYAFSPLTAIGS